MTKVSANTLQEALSQAASQLGCSVTELDYEVLQYESKGVLGLGKKEAIIIANLKENLRNATNLANEDTSTQNILTTNVATQTKDATISTQDSNNAQPEHTAKQTQDVDSNETFFDASEFITPTNAHDTQVIANTKQEIQTKKFQTKEEVAQEIKQLIKEMLDFTPYKIDNIDVSFYDNQTLSIYIDGEDSALLIGERGYRYKAISYLLFNWIQPTYGYNIRLEIAQFLQNQENAIDAYLVGIINEVKREGKAQTKPLDGILAFIALKKLRTHFPDKYISFRENPQNEKYIIINDFYH